MRLLADGEVSDELRYAGAVSPAYSAFLCATRLTLRSAWPPQPSGYCSSRADDAAGMMMVVHHVAYLVGRVFIS
jgi:hypothetical protein